MNSKKYFILFIISGMVSCSFYPNRDPSSKDNGKFEKVEIAYFGDDDGKSKVNLKEIEKGVELISTSLKKYCGFEVEFEVKKEAPISFSENVEFPVVEEIKDTPEGKFPFIYEQYSLYKNFSRLGLDKKQNELYVIKTSQLGTIAITGKARELCAHASPEVQYNPKIPDSIKKNTVNTVLINEDQSKCLSNRSFSIIVAHEITHLLVNDNPPHTVTDEFERSYDSPQKNLMNAGPVDIVLERKYQCTRIYDMLTQKLGVEVNEI